MNGSLGSIAIFTSLLRPKPESFIMRDAFKKAFLTNSPSALSLVGAEVLATFMFLLTGTLVLLKSQQVVDRKDSAAKESQGKRCQEECNVDLVSISVLFLYLAD